MVQVRRQASVSRGPVKVAAPTAQSIASRIRPIGEYSPYIKILLYGDSGSGKTTVWASFPKPILSIICSGGLNSGESRSINSEENPDIYEIVINSTDDMKGVINHLTTVQSYATVVVDHTTGFQDITLKDVLGLEIIPAQKSWGMASREQYGQSTLQCKECFRAIYNLDCHTVFIAQERVFKGKEDGLEGGIVKPTIGAGLSPSLAGWVNSTCDYVVQTFLRPKMIEQTMIVAGKPVKSTVKLVKANGDAVMEYCGRCTPHEVFHTKFRVPKGRRENIPDVIVDPSYEKINAIINGEI